MRSRTLGSRRWKSERTPVRRINSPWTPVRGISSQRLLALGILLLACIACTPRTDEAIRPDRLQVLFLGDDRGHRPAERLRDVARPMLDRGIELNFTTDLDELNLDNLRRYDALLLYANHPHLSPEHEEALLTYVEEGGGFVPVHAASGNFLNSRRYLDLVGGQFLSHEDEVFRTRIAEPEHEIMQGFPGFASWDETYVHQNHNEENRTVLSYREDEPYTWIRTHGDGRVFYTAWGHNELTWRNPGFHDLLERGIRWAAGLDVQEALASRTIENPFRYAVLDVPYPPPHIARLDYEESVGPMDRSSNYPLWFQKQEPLGPEEAIERMIVPPGFRVELFASEPDVVNPMSLNWDDRGRLWVIESVEYPYTREFWPDGGGKDRILILEDTNGDGRADKVTTFADGFNIPTSLAFWNGGVIVHQAPQTFFLKDTTGNDRADVREVLIEGWNQWDTHAGPNHLHYGLDNWIWGVLGYSGMEGTVGGEHHEFRMGIYRFRPDGSKLEFLRRTNNNTWGLGFNEQGGAFISTANGNPSTYLQFPRRLYDLLPDLNDSVTDRIATTSRIITLSNLFRQVDWVGAYTAASGHALYTARTYPQEYWNRIAFVAEPTGQLVGEFILEESGSTYQAPHPRNLIASDDEWFSPVAVEVGPDGHVWIADWYNYILQHNAESDRQRPAPGNAYANPLRDRRHGRIYRIVYEGEPSERGTRASADRRAGTERTSLAGASPDRLVDALRHENMLWRKHAQRLLVERGQTDVVPALIELVDDRSVDAVGLNAGAIHALWTLHGLGQLDGRNDVALAAARRALEHPSAGVRRNAVQVLPKDVASVPAIVGLLQDGHAQVRLEALVALADMPASEDAGQAIYAALGELSNAEDRWIREAATLAAAVHRDGFLAAAEGADAGASHGAAADPAALQAAATNPAAVLTGASESDASLADDPAVTLTAAATLIRNQVDREAGDPLAGAAEPADVDEAEVVLEIGVTVDMMRFDLEELSVEAGRTVRLVFRNTDHMEHNLLVIRPGSLERVGRAADQMMVLPEGRQQHYVPNTPDVLAFTPVLEPGESYELRFTAPEEPGEYPYVCTIPGHWRIMQGTLVVRPRDAVL